MVQIATAKNALTMMVARRQITGRHNLPVDSQGVKGLMRECIGLYVKRECMYVSPGSTISSSSSSSAFFFCTFSALALFFNRFARSNNFLKGCVRVRVRMNAH